MEEKSKKYNKSAIFIIFISSIIIIILAFLLFYFSVVEVSTELPLKQNFNVNPQPVVKIIPTEIIKFIPPEILPKEQKTGDCFAGSVSAQYRQDAFRCIVDNLIYDPCFTIKNSSGQVEKGILYCPDIKEDSKSFILKIAKNLPEREIPETIKTNWAWHLILFDGTECSPFTGTRPFFGNPDNLQVAYYGCNSSDENKQIVLLDELTEDKIWTAQKAILEKVENEWKIKSIEKVSIKTIWQ